MDNKYEIGLYNKTFDEGLVTVKKVCSCGLVQEETYYSIFDVPKTHTCNQCNNKTFYEYEDLNDVSEGKEVDFLRPAIFDVVDDKLMSFKISNISFTLKDDKITIKRSNLVREIIHDYINNTLEVKRNGEREFFIDSDSVYGHENYDRIANYVSKYLKFKDMLPVLNLKNPDYYTIVHELSKSKKQDFFSVLFSCVRMKDETIQILTSSGLKIKPKVFSSYIQLDTNETKPHKILGLPKSWFKYMVSNKRELSYYTLEGLRGMIRLIDVENINQINRLAHYVIDDMSEERYYYMSTFRDVNRLINNYNYKPTDLLHYLIDELPLTQAIHDIYNSVSLLIDYVRMSDELGINNYERYPKSLKLKHDIVSDIHQSNNGDFNEDKFKYVVNKQEYKELEYVGKTFSVIVPREAENVSQEGKDLGHCVGSYVKSIEDEKTKIAFLRRNKNIDKPNVTVEIRDGALVQARGRFNRSITDEERNFLSRYCETKKIRMGVH